MFGHTVMVCILRDLLYSSVLCVIGGIGGLESEFNS